MRGDDRVDDQETEHRPDKHDSRIAEPWDYWAWRRRWLRACDRESADDRIRARCARLMPGHVLSVVRAGSWDPS